MSSLPAPTLRGEVVHQLDSDILSYGWIRQIADTQFGVPARASRHAVLDVIISLVDSGTAVVGEAYRENETVLIRAWTERSALLRRKLESRLDASSPKDQEWAFWLQLKNHYEEKA